MELVLTWYEEVLRCALLGPQAVVKYEEYSHDIQAAAARVGPTGARQQLSAVYDTVHALERNANQRLAVEDLLVRLVELEERYRPSSASDG